MVFSAVSGVSSFEADDDTDDSVRTGGGGGGGGKKRILCDTSRHVRQS